MFALALVAAGVATLITAAARGQAFPFGGPSDPAGSPILWIDPGFDFPAVGNVDLVREWRLGRIDRAEIRSGDPDATIRIRDAYGRNWDIVGPRGPLQELARASNWMDPDKQFPGSADYVERMVAFDVDESGRLIAMVSLETVHRHRANLRRALGRTR